MRWNRPDQWVTSKGQAHEPLIDQRLRSVLTVSLGDVGTIANVVNDTGGSVPNPAGNTTPRQVVAYP